MGSCIICGQPVWRVRTAYCKKHRPTFPSRHTVVTFQGELLTIGEWAKRIGMNPGTLVARFARCGWSAERALTTPAVNKHRRWISPNF